MKHEVEGDTKKCLSELMAELHRFLSSSENLLRRSTEHIPELDGSSNAITPDEFFNTLSDTQIVSLFMAKTKSVLRTLSLANFIDAVFVQQNGAALNSLQALAHISEAFTELVTRFLLSHDCIKGPGKSHVGRLLKLATRFRKRRLLDYVASIVMGIQIRCPYVEVCNFELFTVGRFPRN